MKQLHTQIQDRYYNNIYNGCCSDRTHKPRAYKLQGEEGM